MGSDDVQTVRGGFNRIRLKSSCQDGPEGGPYPHLRTGHTGFLPRVRKAEGCTFYALNGMPLPCFLLHSPFMHHSYRSIALSSIISIVLGYLPAAFLAACLLSHDRRRANRPLTLSLTKQKVIDLSISRPKLFPFFLETALQYDPVGNSLRDAFGT